MRNNLDGDVTKSYRMNTQCMFKCVVCWLAPVLPTGIYIYIYIYISIKFFKFGIFSKSLVYKFLIWNIWKFWYIFVGGFIWDFKQIYLVYYKAETDKPIVVLKLYKKV